MFDWTVLNLQNERGRAGGGGGGADRPVSVPRAEDPRDGTGGAGGGGVAPVVGGTVARATAADAEGLGAGGEGGEERLLWLGFFVRDQNCRIAFVFV